jgi:hypothetical protein
VPHSPQRSLRKPCARMPHSRNATNSSLMKPGNSAPVPASVMRDEAGRMLLHQPVQSGLLQAVAFVVNRGAIRCPLGLPTDGLHDGLARW